MTPTSNSSLVRKEKEPVMMDDTSRGKYSACITGLVRDTGTLKAKEDYTKYEKCLRDKIEETFDASRIRGHNNSERIR
jgi:hypothetical protein